MTLGTAASSSIQNVRASEIRMGAISARKIAAPTPTGIASRRPSADVTAVPKRNGNAPKSSKTGSQVRVTRNCQPNFSRARAEFRYNSKTSRPVIRMMEEAKTSVTRCATSSPARKRARNTRMRTGGRASSTVTALLAMLSNPGNSFHFLGNHFLGQPSIGERFGHLLPIGQHPMQEIRNGLALHAIGDPGGNQQPGETGDGICILPGRIGYGNSKVIRHLPARASRRSGDACQVGVYKVASGIAHRAVGHLVLDCVNQLD